jgi:hypothetical protein
MLKQEKYRSSTVLCVQMSATITRGRRTLAYIQYSSAVHVCMLLTYYWNDDDQPPVHVCMETLLDPHGHDMGEGGLANAIQGRTR